MSSIDSPVPEIESHDDRMAETLETAAQREIDELRHRLTQKETALARAPVNLRRMTRATANLLGVYF